MPNRPSKYKSGGKGRLGGLLGAYLGGKVTGGVGEDGNFTPYGVSNKFTDTVFNQGRGAQAAMQGNMVMDRARMEDTLARARLVDELKNQELIKVAERKRLGEIMLGRGDPNDPIYRAGMAEAAPLMEKEASANTSVAKDREILAAIQANSGTVGNAYIQEQIANARKAEALQQEMAQIVSFLKNNPQFTEHSKLAGLESTLAGTRATNLNSDIEARKFSETPQGYFKSGMESAMTENTLKDKLNNALLSNPDYIPFAVNNAMARQPGLVYPGKVSGTFTSFDAGGPTYEQRINPITGMPETVRVEKPPSINTFGKVSQQTKDSVLNEVVPPQGGSPAISSPPPLTAKPQLKGIIADDSILAEWMRSLKGNPRGLSQGIRPYGY